MKRKYFNITIIIGLMSVLATSCTHTPPQATTTPAPTVEVATPSITAQPSIANTPAPTDEAGETTNEAANVDSLVAGGYDPESIQTCESYLNRIILQLNEIETFSRIKLQPTEVEDPFEGSARFSELRAKIDEQKGVYYIAKLNHELNSLEEAANEYLFTLQADIDIQLYFTDKEKYDEQKNSLLSSTTSDEYITVRAIDEEALENLQNINNSNNTNNVPGLDINPQPGPNIVNPQPDIPTVDIPKPVNPSEEIQNKLLPF